MTFCYKQEKAWQKIDMKYGFDSRHWISVADKLVKNVNMSDFFRYNGNDDQLGDLSVIMNIIVFCLILNFNDDSFSSSVVDWCQAFDLPEVFHESTIVVLRDLQTLIKSIQEDDKLLLMSGTKYCDILIENVVRTRMTSSLDWSRSERIIFRLITGIGFNSTSNEKKTVSKYVVDLAREEQLIETNRWVCEMIDQINPDACLSLPLFVDTNLMTTFPTFTNKAATFIIVDEVLRETSRIVTQEKYLAILDAITRSHCIFMTTGGTERGDDTILSTLVDNFPCFYFMTMDQEFTQKLVKSGGVRIALRTFKDLFPLSPPLLSRSTSFNETWPSVDFYMKDTVKCTSTSSIVSKFFNVESSSDQSMPVLHYEPEHYLIYTVPEATYVPKDNDFVYDWDNAMKQDYIRKLISCESKFEKIQDVVPSKVYEMFDESMDQSCERDHVAMQMAHGFGEKEFINTADPVHRHLERDSEFPDVVNVDRVERNSHRHLANFLEGNMHVFNKSKIELSETSITNMFHKRISFSRPKNGVNLKFKMFDGRDIDLEDLSCSVPKSREIEIPLYTDEVPVGFEVIKEKEYDLFKKLGELFDSMNMVTMKNSQKKYLLSTFNQHNLGVILYPYKNAKKKSAEFLMRLFFVTTDQILSKAHFHPDWTFESRDSQSDHVLSVSRLYRFDMTDIVHFSKMSVNLSVIRNMITEQDYVNIFWALWWCSQSVKGMLSFLKYVNIVAHSNHCKINNLVSKYFKSVDKRRVDSWVRKKFFLLLSKYQESEFSTFLTLSDQHKNDINSCLEIHNIYSFARNDITSSTHNYQTFYHDILNNLSTRKTHCDLEKKRNTEFTTKKHVNTDALARGIKLAMQDRTFSDEEISREMKEEFRAFFVANSNHVHPYTFRKEKGTKVIFDVMSLYLKETGETHFSEMKFILWGLDKLEKRGAFSFVSEKRQNDVADREIYVQEFFTKLGHYPLSCIFRLICSTLPTELVSKSEIGKLEAIQHAPFGENVLFTNGDRKKWSPQDIRSKFETDIDILFDLKILSGNVCALLKRSLQLTDNITLLFDSRIKSQIEPLPLSQIVPGFSKESSIFDNFNSKAKFIPVKQDHGWPQGLLHFISSFTHVAACAFSDDLISHHCLTNQITVETVSLAHSDDLNSGSRFHPEPSQELTEEVSLIATNSALAFSLADSDTKTSKVDKGSELKNGPLYKKRISEFVSVYNIEGSIMNSYMRQVAKLTHSFTFADFINNHNALITRCLTVSSLSNDLIIPERIYSIFFNYLASRFSWNENDNIISWGGRKSVSLRRMNLFGIVIDNVQKMIEGDMVKILTQMRTPLTIQSKSADSKKRTEFMNKVKSFYNINTENFRKLSKTTQIMIDSEYRRICSITSGVFLNTYSDHVFNFFIHKNRKCYQLWRQAEPGQDMMTLEQAIEAGQRLTAVTCVIDELAVRNEENYNEMKEELTAKKVWVSKSPDIKGIIARKKIMSDIDLSTEFETALNIVNKGQIVSLHMDRRKFNQAVSEIEVFCKLFEIKTRKVFEGSRDLWDYIKRFNRSRQPILYRQHKDNSLSRHKVLKVVQRDIRWPVFNKSFPVSFRYHDPGSFSFKDSTQALMNLVTDVYENGDFVAAELAFKKGLTRIKTSFEVRKPFINLDYAPLMTRLIYSYIFNEVLPAKGTDMIEVDDSEEYEPGSTLQMIFYKGNYLGKGFLTKEGKLDIAFIVGEKLLTDLQRKIGHKIEMPEQAVEVSNTIYSNIDYFPEVVSHLSLDLRKLSKRSQLSAHDLKPGLLLTYTQTDHSKSKKCPVQIRDLLNASKVLPSLKKWARTPQVSTMQKQKGTVHFDGPQLINWPSEASVITAIKLMKEVRPRQDQKVLFDIIGYLITELELSIRVHNDDCNGEHADNLLTFCRKHNVIPTKLGRTVQHALAKRRKETNAVQKELSQKVHLESHLGMLKSKVVDGLSWDEYKGVDFYVNLMAEHTGLSVSRSDFVNTCTGKYPLRNYSLFLKKLNTGEFFLKKEEFDVISLYDRQKHLLDGIGIDTAPRNIQIVVRDEQLFDQLLEKQKRDRTPFMSVIDSQMPTISAYGKDTAANVQRILTQYVSGLRDINDSTFAKIVVDMLIEKESMPYRKLRDIIEQWLLYKYPNEAWMRLNKISSDFKRNISKGNPGKGFAHLLNEMKGIVLNGPVFYRSFVASRHISLDRVNKFVIFSFSDDDTLIVSKSRIGTGLTYDPSMGLNEETWAAIKISENIEMDVLLTAQMNRLIAQKIEDGQSLTEQERKFQKDQNMKKTEFNDNIGEEISANIEEKKMRPKEKTLLNEFVSGTSLLPVDYEQMFSAQEIERIEKLLSKDVSEVTDVAKDDAAMIEKINERFRDQKLDREFVASILHLSHSTLERTEFALWSSKDNPRTTYLSGYRSGTIMLMSWRNQVMTSSVSVMNGIISKFYNSLINSIDEMDITKLSSNNVKLLFLFLNTMRRSLFSYPEYIAAEKDFKPNMDVILNEFRTVHEPDLIELLNELEKLKNDK
ncbi:RdRp [Tulasnella bunyavirales-like virus 1]|uniref:RNA-directed RNA polymerase L n=1 Tax=Tulasnella bunyavirales-like virus 1 TaxID=3071304 RepID=A0A974MX91_9VIRU|nr:RdRp [Tulasnella bunyavirales-like virus 1]QPB44676.1 RdRp [Tulasnella bunyavirales-like virus 1]